MLFISHKTEDKEVANEVLRRALAHGYSDKHLGPKDNLPWSPPGETDNCPFPGLMCFDEKHAPVYYGREQERDVVIQQLQKMRSGGVPRLLMIVDGSGTENRRCSARACCRG